MQVGPAAGADGIPRGLYDMMKADPLAVTYPDYASGSPRRGGRGLPFEPRALNYAARCAMETTKRCRILLGTTFFRARLCRSMMTLGQAAGTAAALAVNRGLPARQVDAADLQHSLKRQNVATAGIES